MLKVPGTPGTSGPAQPIFRSPERTPDDPDPTRPAQLLAAFRATAETDAGMGAWPRPNANVRLGGRVRSEALEAIVHAVQCSACHATTSGCVGEVAYTVPLWGLGYGLPMHQERIDAVNKLVKAADGGGPIIP
jgi:cytochrome c